jgi:Ca2+-binding RTX toxin-like protein
VITQAAGVQRLQRTDQAIGVKSVQLTQGGIDQLLGGWGADVVIGGANYDIIDANTGGDTIVADNAQLTRNANGTWSVVQLLDAAAAPEHSKAGDADAPTASELEAATAEPSGAWPPRASTRRRCSDSTR